MESSGQILAHVKVSLSIKETNFVPIIYSGMSYKRFLARNIFIKLQKETNKTVELVLM